MQGAAQCGWLGAAEPGSPPMPGVTFYGEDPSGSPALGSSAVRAPPEGPPRAPARPPPPPRA